METIKKIDFQNIILDPFAKKFSNHLLSFSNLKRNQKILIAVSGGMDSMALFGLCKSLEHFNILLAHINHCLRECSEKDMKFVKSIAKQYNIPFFSNNLDPLHIKNGESVESWARNNRYKELHKIATKSGADWIMTAHHGNDQLETVLMNLSRPSGISGLRGIGANNNKLLRPLLPFSKKEIEKFVFRNHIPFVFDSTNNDIAIPRNFLRHKIIKSWENFDSNLVNAIGQSTDHFSEWKESLDHFILNGLIQQVERRKNKFIIPINLIEKNPVFSTIRLLQFLISSSELLWSKNEIDRIRTFLNDNRTGKMLKLKNGWELLNDRQRIIGSRNPKKNTNESLELHLNHSVYFGDYIYKISLADKFSFKNNNHCTEYVNWSILKQMNLKLRIWETGDSFQPLGMTGHQKVSDFLINQKVDRFKKKNQTVMTANGKIFWVCGHRIADWVKINEENIEKVKLHYSLIN